MIIKQEIMNRLKLLQRIKASGYQAELYEDAKGGKSKFMVMRSFCIISTETK